MQSRILPALILLLAGLPLAGGGQVPEPGTPDTVRVLFVGNSYTYYHSMPRMFKAMAEASHPGRIVEAAFTGGGGATLRQHWREGDALEQIKSGRWDYVVLQEQSMLGTGFVENGEQIFGSPEPFLDYARRFARAIREHGAEPVYYMTWSRRERPNQQKYLTWAYMHVARETGGTVAPVGMVWDRLRNEDRFTLYERDGSHPSLHGSWLAAAMLLAVIFDTEPEDLPGRLEGRAILPGGSLAEEQSVLCDLPEEDAVLLREAVAGMQKQLWENGGYFEVTEAISDRRPSLASRILGLLGTAEGQAAALLVVLIFWLAMQIGINWKKKQS